MNQTTAGQRLPIILLLSPLKFKFQFQGAPATLSVNITLNLNYADRSCTVAQC